MRRHNSSCWSSASDIKMEVDEEGEEQEGYGEDVVKAKGRILFRNQLFTLSSLLMKKLKSGAELNAMEDTLYSLDQTFRRGVARDVESFFNAIVLMTGSHPNSSAAHFDITLHIAENARSSYLVNVLHMFRKSFP